MATYIIIAIIAYLLGSISFSVIWGKKLAGIDVREEGSKNAGATNTLRTAGKKAGALTLLCDILKGVVAVLIALVVGNIVGGDIDKVLLLEIAGLMVVIGHMFPIFFQFKGGKGVATTLGVMFIINWQIALICLVFAIVLILITRMVSVGSITAAILFPVLTIFLPEHFIIPGNYLAFAIILALLIAYNHRANIKRILDGTENKLGASKSKS